MSDFKSIKNKINQIDKQLQIFEKETDLCKRIGNIFDISILCEKLFLDSRDLLINESNKLLTTVANTFDDDTALDMGINIFEKNNSLIIDLPLLLPFKKIKGLGLDINPNLNKQKSTQEHCNAIATALNVALLKYLSSHSISRDKYSKAVYMFTNYFNGDFLKNNIPNTDNYEYKRIVDIVVA
ncbi:MAG: hypothetical protein IJ077_01230, partial [Eubacterium sp.]|nr:hypothetical protein [Eubacterium sp.]